MASFQDRVLRLIHQDQLIPKGGRVMVALSGGADSVALTLLLHEIASAADFVFVGIAHLNHQLRRAADADERFCRELAERLSVAVEVGRVDVQAVADRERISIEQAGHRERYAWFDQVANRLGIQRIATAHTRHDQSETYLMRLIRGAGPEGLAGIRPRSGLVIRPFLHVSRQELRMYLAERRQSFREDESNQNLRITRNRVRHELIPFLEAKFSPSIVDVLARTAAIARGDAEWIDEAVRRVSAGIVTYAPGGQSAEVDVLALGRQPIALARRCARQALENVSHRALGFEHIERFLKLAAGPGSQLTEADFPGCRVEWYGSHLIVRRAVGRSQAGREMPRFSYELRIPGEVRVPEAGMAISVRRGTLKAHSKQMTGRAGTVTVAADQLSDELIVRNWQPGDVVKPLGLGGRKKLQDLFVDRKVARSERHTVPIVADSKKGIVWVVGHTVADNFRITANTKGMLILRADKFGGIG
jgi:tRNA(Ile)-lysidine synthase